MKTSTRTMLIAVVASLALLSVAAVAGAGTTPPAAGPEPMPVDDGGMAICLEGAPDCDDMIVEPGDSGGGATGSTGSAAGGTCPVGTPDCVDTPGVGDGPQVVEPTPGMADTYARPFDTAAVGDDDRTVTIDFVSGVEPCYVLDRVDVAYGADAVTITLFEGHDPAAGDVACIEIGVFKRVVITLDEPLAGRALVDGAAA
ncbi:MAG TPA: hypothetical protein VF235_04130 [Actinomycetota bacterium]